MNRDEEFKYIKTALKAEVEKIGSSLEALEAAVGHDLEKQADGEVGHVAGKAWDMVTGGMTGGAHWLAENLPQIATTGSLLGGTTLGGLAYAANKSLDNEDKELAERKSLVNRYKQLTDNVKSDYGIH